ncbi:hypothetical protein QBC44DRAFT_335854 [Cladorrhinum sp. PSN332]|nr:hypothetical protein QBC44DRAFT_335854 [Cladorrhinum sp. PSN332]
MGSLMPIKTRSDWLFFQGRIPIRKQEHPKLEFWHAADPEHTPESTGSLLLRVQVTAQASSNPEEAERPCRPPAACMYIPRSVTLRANCPQIFHNRRRMWVQNGGRNLDLDIAPTCKVDATLILALHTLLRFRPCRRPFSARVLLVHNVCPAYLESCSAVTGNDMACTCPCPTPPACGWASPRLTALLKLTTPDLSAVDISTGRYNKTTPDLP